MTPGMAMLYRLADKNLAGKHTRVEIIGHVEITYCSRSYLDRVIRNAIKKRDLKNVSLEHKTKSGNLVKFEGCRIVSWKSRKDQSPDTTIGFYLGDYPFSLLINEIVEFSFE